MIVLPTADDTRRLGARLADVLRAGDLVVLDGPLGAGKTVLVQGIAVGLGSQAQVTSPTFVIARVHADGRLPLVHVDAYRLSSVLEVDDLDLDTDLAESVVVVEWGAGLVEDLTEAHLRVELRRVEGGEAATGPVTSDESDEGDDERQAVLHPVRGDWAERLSAAGLAPGS